MNRHDRHEAFDQIKEATSNPQQFLAQILSYIFSDQYIFIDKTFRKLLNGNPKGYIHIDDLVKNQLIRKYFESLSIVNITEKESFIREIVESNCSELYYHLSRVRRVTPFKMQQFKKLKPICIERIRQDMSISDVRSYFGQHVFILNASSIHKNDQDLLIYSENYRSQLPNIIAQNPPFKILDFQAYCKQYDLTLRIRQRKLINLMKPIEPPKYRFQEMEYKKARERGRDYRQQSKRESRQNFKEKERLILQQFISIGRQPNPCFNNLLNGLKHEEIEFEN